MFHDSSILKGVDILCFQIKQLYSNIWFLKKFFKTKKTTFFFALKSSLLHLMRPKIPILYLVRPKMPMLHLMRPKKSILYLMRPKMLMLHLMMKWRSTLWDLTRYNKTVLKFIPFNHFIQKYNKKIISVIEVTVTVAFKKACNMASLISLNLCHGFPLNFQISFITSVQHIS